MEFRKPTKKDLKPLAQMYKEAFEVHDIFTKPEEEVIEYLEENMDNFLICEDEGKIIAGCLITFRINKYEHALWRLKHLAVAEDRQREGIGDRLMTAFEKMVANRIEKGEFKSAKAEVHVSENEKDSFPFYMKNGFQVEGRLIDHYRKGEICFVMGKVLG